MSVELQIKPETKQTVNTKEKLALGSVAVDANYVVLTEKERDQVAQGNTEVKA